MLYVTAVVLLMLFLGGFLLFGCYAVIDQVRTSITSQMTHYSGLDTYSNFGLADAFMHNLWNYLAILMLFGLAYWVYIYSQRKSAGVMY